MSVAWPTENDVRLDDDLVVSRQHLGSTLTESRLREFISWHLPHSSFVALPWTQLSYADNVLTLNGGVCVVDGVACDGRTKSAGWPVTLVDDAPNHIYLRYTEDGDGLLNGFDLGVISGSVDAVVENSIGIGRVRMDGSTLTDYWPFSGTPQAMLCAVAMDTGGDGGAARKDIYLGARPSTFTTYSTVSEIVLAPSTTGITDWGYTHHESSNDGFFWSAEFGGLHQAVGVPNIISSDFSLPSHSH